ncbi:AAA family ATPase [Photobacterium damselae subsp. damselae]|uniref:AAA family ATPase n=1 Tax=Photobacterium damselae TaxID=38293 RepID=UPI00311B3A0A
MNQVIEQVKHLRDVERLTQRAIAKESGVTESILSSLLKGTYLGQSDVYEKKLALWVESKKESKAALKEASNELLSEPEFLMLPTAKQIMGLMGVAQSLKSWSMVYEGAGVGKTMAAKEYQRTHNNVWIVTASAFCKTASFVLGELAEQLGIKSQGMTIARLSKAIAKELDGTNGLVVIDEAQYLSDDVLNGLRILIDGKAGGMLLGNDVVRTRMTTTRSKINMKAFWSRVISPANVKHSSAEDIAIFVRAWGINDESMIKYALKVTPKTEGQLRSLSAIIKLAASTAKSKGQDISAQHLAIAHDYLTESLRG